MLSIYIYRCIWVNVMYYEMNLIHLLLKKVVVIVWKFYVQISLNDLSQCFVLLHFRHILQLLEHRIPVNLVIHLTIDKLAVLVVCWYEPVNDFDHIRLRPAILVESLNQVVPFALLTLFSLLNQLGWSAHAEAENDICEHLIGILRVFCISMHCIVTVRRCRNNCSYSCH